jgi:hypothetical protein
VTHGSIAAWRRIFTAIALAGAMILDDPIRGAAKR